MFTNVTNVHKCDSFGDVLTPVAPGDVKILGRPGELLQSSLNARVFSSHAQGAIYNGHFHFCAGSKVTLKATGSSSYPVARKC